MGLRLPARVWIRFRRIAERGEDHAGVRTTRILLANFCSGTVAAAAATRAGGVVADPACPILVSRLRSPPSSVHELVQLLLDDIAGEVPQIQAADFVRLDVQGD